MKKQEKHFFHITCAPGLESALESELKELGLRRLRAGRGAVRFQGSFRAALRVVLWSRVASRVLMELIRVGARDGDELYDEVLHLPWEDRLSAKSTFAIDVIGTSRSLRHTHYTSQRIKDGICDRLRELHLLRNRLTDAVAPALMRLRRLSTLTLVGRRQYLYSLPEDNRISAAALEGLRGLPGLLVLD